MDIFPGGAEAGLFEAFTAPDTNRLLFLERLLKAKDIPCTVVELAGRAHIAVRFGKGAYHPFFQTTTLIAHYDRDEGPPPSPGANDNSAACFLLVELAEKLLTRENHNIMILFTGGEEAGKQGVARQGAFALGTGLRRLNQTAGRVFVLDACGRGDTLILSAVAPPGGSVLHRRKIRAFYKDLEELRAEAAVLAQKSCPGRWLSLPTPYSDNAGLLAAGIPAQLITVLPREEAETLLRTAGGIPGEQFRRLLLAFRDTGNGAVPQTWRMMHTAQDTADTLTPEAFTLMRSFLDALSRDKTPV